jgi:hypothetical protein
MEIRSNSAYPKINSRIMCYHSYRLSDWGTDGTHGYSNTNQLSDLVINIRNESSSLASKIGGNGLQISSWRGRRSEINSYATQGKWKLWFQVNVAGGKWLLNQKHLQPQRESVQNEIALSNADNILESTQSIGWRLDLGLSCKSSRPCLRILSAPLVNSAWILLWISSTFAFSFRRTRMITCCSSSIQQWKSKRPETFTFFRMAALEAMVQMPSSGARKVHSIGYLTIHEPLFGNRWMWPQPRHLDHPRYGQVKLKDCNNMKLKNNVPKTQRQRNWAMHVIFFPERDSCHRQTQPGHC